MSPITSATMPVLRWFSERAMALGRYPISSAMATMRWRSSAEMRDCLSKARVTVDVATPMRSAISLAVTRCTAGAARGAGESG
ncbi:hypothetical protein D3C81_1438330 [compost metagenome]